MKDRDIARALPQPGQRGDVLGRRQFLGGAGALMAALAAAPVLAACSPSGGRSAPSPGSASGSSAPSGDLTFFFGASSPEEKKTRQAVIDAFQTKFPKVKVHIQIAGTDPLQQLLTAAAGGQPPDVMMAWELLYTGLAKRGAMLDLGPLIAADSQLSSQLSSDGSPVLMNTFKYQQKQWALPEQFAGVFLYYNTDLFEQAGVEPPPSSWTDTTWTYAKFIDAAQRLTKKSGGKTTQWGFVDAWAPHLSASVLAMNNGVEWFSPPIGPTSTNMADPRFVAGWQFYADLAAKHQVAPTTEQTASVSAVDLFAQGKAAMALTGHWMYQQFATTSGLNFDVAALPMGPDGTNPKSDIGTTGLAIAADSNNKEAAWEFVKFSCGPEGQQIIAKSGLFVPVLHSVVSSPAFTGAHARLKNTGIFAGALQNANYLPITPAWGKIEPLVISQSTAVLQGKKSADAFASSIAPQIDSLLKSDG
jgi:multiple sugar transport system substrate-binding protein